MLHFSAASRERASNPIRRRSSRSAEGDAAAGWPIRNMGDPNSDGGAGAPDTKELLVVAILHSLPYPRSVPRFQSPHRRRQPPRRSRRSGRGEGSVRDSGPGAHEPLVSIHPVFLCSIPGCVRFPGRFQDSAPKVQHEIENLLFANPALVHAELQQGGSAAPRRLRGTRRAIPPICARSCAREGKRLAVDGETWLNPSVTFSDFEYLAIPHHRPGRRT